ncbi:hypothetical protein QQS21_012047 [Conoideocrella luteorostrata]|uniref:Uncharacterized protein n=1 Tax=Conoideocrella luteorostrata TaxID=1105319 RepID=A0AAJ0CC62_9HYPO|nr:hypothetical protein QQS21_012047 [Conoideocrella luteorostrata]
MHHSLISMIALAAVLGLAAPVNTNGAVVKSNPAVHHMVRRDDQSSRPTTKDIHMRITPRKSSTESSSSKEQGAASPPAESTSSKGYNTSQQGHSGGSAHHPHHNGHDHHHKGHGKLPHKHHGVAKRDQVESNDDISSTIDGQVDNE